MRMKNKLLLSAGILIAIGLASLFIYNRYRIVTPPVDISKSEIGWSAKSVSDVHFGKIQLKNVQLQFQNNNLIGGLFEVDMNSITVEDLKDDEDKQSFIHHITTEDFFETNRYPKAVFVIREVKKQNDQEYLVNGEATIKDITKPVSFKAIATDLPQVTRLSANLAIDRTLFGVEYGSQGKRGSEKDWFIYNDIQLSVNIVASKL